MGKGSTHGGWLLAASLASLVWALLVHLRPPGFFLLGPTFCLGWLFLSWKALGTPRPLARRPLGREWLLGGVLGLGMVGGSLAVAWGVCAQGALAALPTFLVWGLLAEWRQGLAAAVVSHGLWTVLSILLLGGMLN